MDRLMPLASALGETLKAQSESIAVAESSAGGLISAALLAVPGASAYFVGGGVIYTRQARRGLLGLSEDVVTMRAATEDYALILAGTVRERVGATPTHLQNERCQSRRAPRQGRSAQRQQDPHTPWNPAGGRRSPWNPEDRRCPPRASPRNGQAEVGARDQWQVRAV